MMSNKTSKRLSACGRCRMWCFECTCSGRWLTLQERRAALSAREQIAWVVQMRRYKPLLEILRKGVEV